MWTDKVDLSKICCTMIQNDESSNKKCSPDGRFQTWVNLIVVMALQVPRSVAYTITLPSLYQFVTASSNETVCDNQTDTDLTQCDSTFMPGMGQSDIFYSWTVTLFSIGAFTISPLTGVLPRYCTYRFSILLSLLVFLMGALLYAITVQPWMILVARFLLGAYDGASSILLLSYASQVAARIEKKDNALNRKKSKKRWRSFSLKDKLFTADMIHKSFLFLTSLGVSAVMAQFLQIDQYRWPGWFLFSLGTLYTLMFLIAFRETECTEDTKKSEDKCDKLEVKNEGGCNGRCRCSCLCAKNVTCENVLSISYLVCCGYIAFSLFNVSDTLLPLVLSDLFGFEISDNSIFFLLLMLVSLGAGIILIILKCLRTDNRMVLIIALCIGIAGVTLASDWQLVNQDPCTSSFLNTSTESRYSDEMGCQDIHSDILATVCRDSSTGDQHCTWNCVSRVTGKNCQYCRAICRTEEKSINFVQFSVGVVLIVVCTQVFVTVIVSITTDVTPPALQGIAISAVYAANGVARTVTPLWINYVYEVFGRHTHPPFLIINTTLFFALAGVVVLYRQLGHRKAPTKLIHGVPNPTAKELEKRDDNEINLSNLV